jgi:hypothetical protein
MEQPLVSLEQISVASPCQEPWDNMVGDDRVRFCGRCRLNVYNIESMTRDEAENLIRASAGRVCARFYRREDGTILTSDCPVGLRRVRAQVARARAIGAAFVALALSAVAFAGIGRGDGSRLASTEPFATLRVKIFGKPPAPPPRTYLGGVISLAPLPPPVSTSSPSKSPGANEP